MNFRNIRRYFLFSLSACMISSCNDNYPFSAEEECLYPITLSAAYPSATRASDAGFENGDRMGVYVLDYIDGKPQEFAEANASNVRFDFDGTNNSWNGSRDIYWKSGNTPADIITYYPYMADVGNPEEMQFTVSRHQDFSGTDTSLGGYESSDLLRGEAIKQMPTEGKVRITLDHVLAGVRIKLKEGRGFDDGEWSSVEKTVVLPGMVPDGTVNLRDGTVKSGTSSPEPIVPMLYDSDYRAVVFPQTVGAGVSLVAVSIGGTGYNLVKPEPVTFVSGRMHSFTITVDKKTQGDYEFSVSDESIARWIDDVDFRDGVIRSYTTVNVPTRGTLKDIILKEGLDYRKIGNLKLTGEIDENDFYFMRDEMASLKSLNLRSVRVYDGERANVIPPRAMYCKSTLTRIVFPEDLKIIGSSAFHRTGLLGDLIIPEGVEKIGEDINYSSRYHLGVFSYCENLSGSLSIPSTVIHIEHNAFSYSKLSGSLILPEKLKFIGDNAFRDNVFSGELSIPASVDYIGDGSFSGNHFTGSLEIPAGIEVIKSYAFSGDSFSGSLLLPEGIVEIQKHAFEGCKFNGELLLPESLLTLGDYAFKDTRISNIVFPNGLLSIGKGCFMNCVYLNECIVIPENVNRVNEYTFAGDILISEVELHENVTFVGGAAFAGDNNLTNIIVKNQNPPYISKVQEYDWRLGADVEKDPFYGVPLGNVTLKIPEDSRDAYSRAEVWRNIGRHATYNGFGCRPEKICALNNVHQEQIIIDGEGEWEVAHIPSWCSMSSDSGSGKGQVTVSVSGLSKGSGPREDYIEFRIKGTEYTARCDISQIDYQYDEDECIVLQKATKGRGIDVLFVGDGFDATAIANGEYLGLVNEQMQAFFGIEPYATYKDYFNVYACISLSQETGVSTTSTRKNTRFNTRFSSGTGHSVKGLACDDPEGVFDYATAHSPLTSEKMHQSLVIVALNSDQYGSVTSLTENGSAIAIVGRSSEPYPMDTRGMLQHEACGHAFGKLAEERITVNRYIKIQEEFDIHNMLWRGWYQNISLSGKLNEVSWADLIFDPRYSNKVDVYEGGYGVTRGVFRAEINSCMNYGIPYFSAAARLDIMRRILEYSGEGFTMEKFYATDSDKWGEISRSRAAMPDETQNFISSGIHNPVRIIKSKKY